MNIIASSVGVLFFSWLAIQTIRTGMIAGNSAWYPRRDERPVQFWFVVALLVLMAVANGVRLADG
ncbi:hypothetical protein ACPVPU_06630 [Sphingomonas sp. CJ99]